MGISASTMPGTQPPDRRLQPDHWPPEAAADRVAWSRAVAEESYRKRGIAAHLAPGTKKLLAGWYGNFLLFLQRTGQLTDEDIVARVTRERLIAYFTERKSMIGAGTLNQAHKYIFLAVQAMAPGQDWTWINRLPTRATADEVEQGKRKQAAINPVVICAAMLVAMGRIQDQGLDAAGDRYQTARDYRDALLLAFLCSDPYRRRNIAMMELGKQVVVQDDTIHVMFATREMKNKRGRLVTVADWLIPYFRYYLASVRPFLLNGEKSDSLWVTTRRQGMSYGSSYLIIVKASERLLGFRVSPHAFRYGAATHILSANPAALAQAADVLAHKNWRTTSSIYNKSGMAPVTRAWAGALAPIMRAARAILSSRRKGIDDAAADAEALAGDEEV